MKTTILNTIIIGFLTSCFVDADSLRGHQSDGSVSGDTIEKKSPTKEEESPINKPDAVTQNDGGSIDTIQIGRVDIRTYFEISVDTGSFVKTNTASTVSIDTGTDSIPDTGLKLNADAQFDTILNTGTLSNTATDTATKTETSTNVITAPVYTITAVGTNSETSTHTDTSIGAAIDLCRATEGKYAFVFSQGISSYPGSSFATFDYSEGKCNDIQRPGFSPDETCTDYFQKKPNGKTIACFFGPKCGFCKRYCGYC